MTPVSNELVTRIDVPLPEAMMSVDLAPCPLCGGSNTYIEPDEVGSGGQWVTPIHVGCTDCGLDMAQHDYTDDAVAAWNRRAATSPAGDQDHVLVPRAYFAVLAPVTNPAKTEHVGADMSQALRERVARVICDKTHGRLTYNELPDSRKAAWMDIADAALAAMRGAE